jgi:hypothetical protein
MFKVNRIILYIIIVVISFSCENKSTKKACNSGLYKKVENLIFGNEFVVKSEGFYSKTELKRYLTAIKNINDLKYKIIVASGGIDPDDYNIMNGCKHGGEIYYNIYQESAIFEEINKIDVQGEIDSFDKIFEANLDTFFNNSNMFSKKYFEENSTTAIALDISLIELEMYGVLFYHHPHCN